MAGSNSSLGTAKAAKNDEFYTQYPDIQAEVNAYIEYNPDVFKGKTILLPCDDPEWSNFTKFFTLNFEKFGLKKLISTSYAVESKKYKDGYIPSLFEQNNQAFDPDKTRIKGKIFTITQDENKDGHINIDDLKWHYLDGDGDFRSEEVKALRDEADIIVTNPPFSLFREFVAWIMEANKKFLIIGNIAGACYKEIFPLIKDNLIWPGKRYHGRVNGKNMTFLVPDNITATGTEVYIENGHQYTSVPTAGWFTNIDHGRRHEPLQLMTEADNIKYSKHKEVRGIGYAHYENYDAIEIPYVDAIPSDYEGMMGVPVTFIDKYCPEQFEILGMCENEDLYKLKTRKYTTEECRDAYKKKFGRKGTYDLNASAVLSINGQLEKMYARIIIRKK